MKEIYISENWLEVIKMARKKKPFKIFDKFSDIRNCEHCNSKTKTTAHTFH